MDTKRFEELVGNPKNPRRISKFSFDNLVQSIKEFGDLSGITFNQTTGHLVGGHQRVEAFKKLGGEHKVFIDSRFEPNRVGTVAIGRFEHEGEMFHYREVQWDEPRELAANIAANRIEGEWDLDLLAEVNYYISQQNEDLLKLTGQTEEELKNLLKVSGALPGADPEVNPEGLLDGDTCTCPKCGFEFEAKNAQ